MKPAPKAIPRAIAIAGLVCAFSAPWPDSAIAEQPLEPPEDFAISLPAEDSATVGDSRALSLSITPRPGYSISQDGPLVIDLAVTPKDGLTLRRRRYLRRHAADPRAATPRFDLTYGAKTAGRHTITMSLRFWLCGKRTCRPIRTSERVHIDVSEAPAKKAASPR